MVYAPASGAGVRLGRGGSNPLIRIAVIAATGTMQIRMQKPIQIHIRPGGVAQLARAPACHAGGRRFESGRPRTI